MAKSKAKPATTIQSDSSQWIVRPLYLILFFLLMAFILGGVFLSQQTKLTSIAEKKQELQTKLDSLTVEKERLEQMLEYMETDEYLEQYAREKLGYVYPDDIKFSDSEASYTSPLATAVPTGMPESTAELRPTATPAPTLPPTPTPTRAPRPTPDPNTSIVVIDAVPTASPQGNAPKAEVVPIG